MSYKQPEVLALGEANGFILGAKGGFFGEGGDITKRSFPGDAELDD